MPKHVSLAFFSLYFPSQTNGKGKQQNANPSTSLSLSLFLNGCSKAKETLSGLISLRTPVAVDELALRMWVKVVSSLLADFGGLL